MSGYSRHKILRDGADVGTLSAMPWHGQVCLHTEDSALVELLVEEGLATPRRPPYLDAAAGDGVHGAYRPRPQVNVFFEPPLESVVEALKGPLERAGYALAASEA